MSIWNSSPQRELTTNPLSGKLGADQPPLNLPAAQEHPATPASPSRLTKAQATRRNQRQIQPEHPERAANTTPHAPSPAAGHVPHLIHNRQRSRSTRQKSAFTWHTITPSRFLTGTAKLPISPSLEGESIAEVPGGRSLFERKIIVELAAAPALCRQVETQGRCRQADPDGHLHASRGVSYRLSGYFPR